MHNHFANRNDIANIFITISLKLAFSLEFNQFFCDCTSIFRNHSFVCFCIKRRVESEEMGFERNYLAAAQCAFRQIHTSYLFHVINYGFSTKVKFQFRMQLNKQLSAVFLSLSSHSEKRDWANNHWYLWLWFAVSSFGVEFQQPFWV